MKYERIMIVALSLGVVHLAACSSTTSRPESEAPPATGASDPVLLGTAAERRTPLSDDAITRAIEREVLYDGSVSIDQLEINTRNGIVELTGTADHLLAKQRASALARSVKGVRAVSNRLELAVPVRADAQLVADVRELLLLDPTTEAFQVEVEAEDGRVTLTGQVESWQEKQVAARVAQRVKGVRAVVNGLTVRVPPERSDEEIANDVRSRLRWDALVDHELIDVSVENGLVTLDGIVGSAAESVRAQADAWVVGIKGVNGDRLEVRWWAEDDYQRGSEVVLASDREIAAGIENALAYDPRVSSAKIQPVVRNRQVTLLGAVPTLRAKRAAELISTQTVGVLGVTNELRIGTSTPIPDDTLRARIIRALAMNPLTDAPEISVSVDDGKVRLSGRVDTFSEQVEASEIAGSFAGATEVDNQLEVQRPIAPYVPGPYLDPFDPLPTYVRGDRPLRDETLHRAILRELLWDPHVDAWQVQVSVEGGRATLTGTVDSWVERFRAMLNAVQAGANRVDNQLEVK